MKKIAMIFLFVVSSGAFAEGSISRSQVILEVSEQSPELSETLKKLDLSEVGEAMRAGRHTGIGGARLMPYTFLSKDGSLTVTIYDDNGKIAVDVRNN